ncbi:unnamed protein product [Sphacelaria rigidula]
MSTAVVGMTTTGTAGVKTTAAATVQAVGDVAVDDIVVDDAIVDDVIVDDIIVDNAAVDDIRMEYSWLSATAGAAADGADAPVAAHEPSKTPRRKPLEVSSRVSLTPHKRRGELERRATRSKANGGASAADRDGKARRSKHRHRRRRHHRNDDAGGGSRSGHGGGGSRKASSKPTEVPRTAVSRMLQGRSKTLRSTRHVFQSADKMKTELKVRDRIHRLRVYKKCFSGREAVQWMLSNGHATSINEAKRLGNEMMKNGVFEHISNSHLFEDSSVLYRFSDGQELPPPASGGRRIGQMARVVFKSLVNGVFGGKDDVDFEDQISEIVSGSGGLSVTPDYGSQADGHRSTAFDSDHHRSADILVKKVAAAAAAADGGFGSESPTEAPSVVSSGPYLSQTESGEGANLPTVGLRVHESAAVRSRVVPGGVKPPRIPSSKSGRKRRHLPGVNSENLNRFNSSVSATTLPETPTPF